MNPRHQSTGSNEITPALQNAWATLSLLIEEDSIQPTAISFNASKLSIHFATQPAARVATLHGKLRRALKEQDGNFQHDNCQLAHTTDGHLFSITLTPGLQELLDLATPEEDFNDHGQDNEFYSSDSESKSSAEDDEKLVSSPPKKNDFHKLPGDYGLLIIVLSALTPQELLDIASTNNEFRNLIIMKMDAWISYIQSRYPSTSIIASALKKVQKTQADQREIKTMKLDFYHWKISEAVNNPELSHNKKAFLKRLEIVRLIQREKLTIEQAISIQDPQQISGLTVLGLNYQQVTQTGFDYPLIQFATLRGVKASDALQLNATQIQGMISCGFTRSQVTAAHFTTHTLRAFWMGLRYEFIAGMDFSALPEVATREEYSQLICQQTISATTRKVAVLTSEGRAEFYEKFFTDGFVNLLKSMLRSVQMIWDKTSLAQLQFALATINHGFINAVEESKTIGQYENYHLNAIIFSEVLALLISRLASHEKGASASISGNNHYGMKHITDYFGHLDLTKDFKLALAPDQGHFEDNMLMLNFMWDHDDQRINPLFSYLQKDLSAKGFIQIHSGRVSMVFFGVLRGEFFTSTHSEWHDLSATQQSITGNLGSKFGMTAKPLAMFELKSPKKKTWELVFAAQSQSRTQFEKGLANLHNHKMKKSHCTYQDYSQYGFEIVSIQVRPEMKKLLLATINSQRLFSGNSSSITESTSTTRATRPVTPKLV